MARKRKTQTNPIPEQVLIYGHRYPYRRVCSTDMNGNFGDVRYSTGIRVNDDLPPFEEALTSLHECTHPAFAESGMDFMFKTEEQSEGIIRQATLSICLLLKDNPQYAEYFMDLIHRSREE